MMGVLGLASAAGLLPFFSSPAWMRIQPLFLLEWNLDGGHRNLAMTEFLQRYRAGMVQDEVLIRHARAALGKQKQNADASVIFWDGASGDVIEEAILAGLLSPQEIEQYVRTVVSVDMRFIQRVHQNDVGPELRMHAGLGSNGRQVQVSVQACTFEFDDSEFQRQLQLAFPSLLHATLPLGRGDGRGVHPVIVLTNIAPGLKKGRAQVILQVEDLSGKPLLASPLPYSAELETYVVPDDKPLTELYSDPAEKAVFEEEIMVDHVRFTGKNDGTMSISTGLHIRSAPSKLIGVLKMRLCEKDVSTLPQELQNVGELIISDITIEAGREYQDERSSLHTLSLELAAALPESICVELWIEPSGDAATTEHVWRMLGDRIELGRAQAWNPWK
jgi:hypothetical protein